MLWTFVYYLAQKIKSGHKKGGGPSGVYAGRADVLRTLQGGSMIWKIKQNNPKNLQVGSKQLERYHDAAKTKPKDFPVPLWSGYDFETFYVQYTSTTCLEISSTSVPGLVFYREMPSSDLLPGPVVVEIPFSEAQKDYALD